MLGIEKINIVIKEPFASQIREKLKRFRNNELNDEEIAQVKRMQKILKKYKATWVEL